MVVPSLYGGQPSRGEYLALEGNTYHCQYDSGIVVPELMHNPHTGHDAKEEEDQDDGKESDSETEDSRSPVALLASHSHVLLRSGVKEIGECLA